jgi:uncharacterized membrane protein YeaQ/YmgE (transglycosylase-associated protein family)
MVWSVIVTILIGALSGYIAGLIMKISGGFWFNCLLGIVGSIVGRFLASLLGIYASKISLGSILLSVAGACLVIWLVRKIGSKA